MTRKPTGSLHERGTYALLLFQRHRRPIRVGRLGPIDFDRRWYIYVGSAFGPGGLAARLRRHLRCDPGKVLRWHIDYLRAASQVRTIWFHTGPALLEHHWADSLCGPDLGGKAVARFGSSDCRCPSHLAGFTRRPRQAAVTAILTGGKTGFGAAQNGPLAVDCLSGQAMFDQLAGPCG